MKKIAVPVLVAPRVDWLNRSRSIGSRVPIEMPLVRIEVCKRNLQDKFREK